MFTVFDRITGKPLVIHLTEDTDKGETIVLSDKALIICTTSVAAKRVVRGLFGGADVQALDPKTGASVNRYEVRHSRGSGRVALKKLVELTGVKEFWDGKRLGVYTNDGGIKK